MTCLKNGKAFYSLDNSFIGIVPRFIEPRGTVYFINVVNGVILQSVDT